GIPAETATCFTGGGTISFSRPRGRSGCVNTAPTSKSFKVRKCFRQGTANCGVPQKTILIAAKDEKPFRRLPLPLLAQFLDLSLDQVALQHAQMLQKQNSVQVVNFMAKRARQQIFSANLKPFTLSVLRFHRYELWPHHISAESRYRKTPFFFALFAFCVNNLRIHQHNFCFGIFPTSHINYRDSNAFSDLWGRQSHTLRRIHRCEHILGKFFQFRIKLCDWFCRLFEY